MMRHEGLAKRHRRGVLRAAGMLGSTALRNTSGSRPQTFADRCVRGQPLRERPHHAAMPVRIALLAIVVEVLLAGAACADHLWWMQPYRTHGGGSCCSEVNCVPATVVAGPDGQVIVNRVPLCLPPGSVHPVPDGVDTGWWCYQGHAGYQPPTLTLEISAACARCVFFRRTPGDI